MIIPYYEEIVNSNKDQRASYRDWNNTFIGFLTPNGEVYNAYKDHNIGTISDILWSGCFSSLPYRRTQEQQIEKLLEYRERYISLYKQGKLDRINTESCLISIDYAIKFYQNYLFPRDEFAKNAVQKLSQLNNYVSATQDFMTQALDYDKVERIWKSITTTKPNINETFFNYLIMDYNIYQIPRLVYNKENIFSEQHQSSHIQIGKERECEEEIQLIKKYIPLNERPKYFK